MQFRKHEFDLQCDAVRRGLASVVPFASLHLFTWEELQTQVCGVPTVDVDLLSRITVYEGGVKPDDHHVAIFWKMMRERFDAAQKCSFLKFGLSASFPASMSLSC